MRTLRVALAGTVMLVLLGGTGGTAVVAQSDENVPADPMRPSHFTMTDTDTLSFEPEEWLDGEGYQEVVGRESVFVVEASDPRISGFWTQVVNNRAFPIDEAADVWAAVGSAAVRIANMEGSWVGTTDGYDDGAVGHGEWNRFVGEGGYDGLTAIFRYDAESGVFDGVIIPGVPPDYPAPIELSAE
jgi:hypothetical protein